MKSWLDKLWVRIGLSLLVGLVFGLAVSEASYIASPDHLQREPWRVELVIPEGTAQKLNAGQAVSIPQEMTFVEGDVLVVKNMDVVSHQLGPVWVPPQSSGVVQVGTGDSMTTYECSFTKSRSFGIDVQAALTTWTRIQGMITIGLPTGIILALYMAIAPQLKESHEDGANA